MPQKQRVIALQVISSFVFVVLFWLTAYFIIMELKLIEDDIFFYNHFLVGFYQWAYTLPIIIYLKRRGKVYLGFLIGGIVLTLLNLSLFLWIFIDPSFFF